MSDLAVVQEAMALLEALWRPLPGWTVAVWYHDDLDTIHAVLT